MATPDFAIFEDITTFDVVWKRVSEDEYEAEKTPSEFEGDGTFKVERASPPASSSTAQVSSASSIPMIATFEWEHFSAQYSCVYNQISRSYDGFDLVKGSMSHEFASALLIANESNSDPLHTDLSEFTEGVWKLEMNTMYNGPRESFVELWAKKRVNGMRMEATASDRRDWGLARDASMDEEEDEEEGGDQEVDSSEDESDVEGEREGEMEEEGEEEQEQEEEEDGDDNDEDYEEEEDDEHGDT